MIGVRAPFRLSLIGGGSDLRGFYRRAPGKVVSTTIDKYIYVYIHPFFDQKIHVRYSKTELVDHPGEIKHPIVREVLSDADLRSVDVISIADVPAGTGLGSSSAFTAAMLMAVSGYQSRLASKRWIAEEACRIEMDRLGEPIGKQDAYASTFGGFNTINFFGDETVRVEPLPITNDTRRLFDDHILMFFTGSIRSASDILAVQSAGLESDDAIFENTQKMVDLVDPFCDALVSGDLAACGGVLDEAWQIKRRLTSRISSPEIDNAYAAAMAAGACGGKLVGAGGSGFLAIMAPPDKHADIRAALSDLREMPIRCEHAGTHIIYNEARRWIRPPPGERWRVAPMQQYARKADE